MTLFEQLEAKQPNWREDIAKAFEAAVEDVGVEGFMRAVYGASYIPATK
jgi:hypothetical protein